MAGDWLKMTHGVPEKPEVLAISGATGINRLEVVGRLFIMWRWFDQNTLDGNAVGVTKVTLTECLFGYSSDTKFIEAVIATGWLIDSGTGISVKNFDSHISESAKERAQTAKRVAKSKSKGAGNEVTLKSGKGNGDSVTKTVPREEKRREEVTTPLTPQGGKKPAIAFQTFIDQCKATGEKAISEYTPVWDYARHVGLPAPFVELAWWEFARQMGPGGTSQAKRQKDWRSTFRNYVEKGYLKLWILGENGQFKLTSAGQIAERATKQRETA